MIEDLTACFDGLVDPRVTRRCDHRLIDILMIAIRAVIACAESWEDIELYGRSKQAWLKTFLALPNGIPSHDTFRRVFMLLDPDAFEGCFARGAQSLTRKVEREVVAIDGKTVRRSGSSRHDHGPLHLVSAWASDQGLDDADRRQGLADRRRQCPALRHQDHGDSACGNILRVHRRERPASGARLWKLLTHWPQVLLENRLPGREDGIRIREKHRTKWTEAVGQ
jgi:hypothetical protein